MKQICILLVATFLLITNGYAQEVVQRKFQKMGSSFEITLVHENPIRAEKLIDESIAEIDRIERLISSWDQDSQTSLVNKMAGSRAQVVSKELFDLIKRANAIGRLTDGAFDISYASVDKLWSFTGEEMQSPSAAVIKTSVAKIGFQKIVLDEEKQTVFLPEKGMKIGFGAIGKGYAADRVKAMLQQKGVKAGIVNASGDMSAWGTQPDGTPWQVGLVNPLNKNKVFSWFPLNDTAVVTSGDYERYLLMNGKRYGHIINPKTGYPSQGVVSCTVFAPKAELADALATALFVMGTETGINFIDQLPSVEALMINDSGNIITSKNIAVDEIN